MAFTKPSVPSFALITLFPPTFKVNAIICRIAGESATVKIESITEIHHSNFNKTAVENLFTILRQLYIPSAGICTVNATMLEGWSKTCFTLTIRSRKPVIS
jgi:hypothetical protein